MKTATLFSIFVSLCFFTSTLNAEAVSLRDLFAIANTHNPSLIEARLTIQKNTFAKNVQSSQFLPQIHANSSSYKDQTPIYSIQASQLIFDGFQSYHNVKESEYTLLSSIEDLHQIEASTRYEVTLAYLNILRNNQLILLNKSIHKTRKNSYKLVALRYNAGQENQGALLIAKANLADSDFELKKNTRNSRLVMQSLEQSLGKAISKTHSVLGDITQVPTLIKPKNFIESAHNTPLIKKIDFQYKASTSALKALKASSLPQISGTASYTYNPGSIVQKEDSNYGASLSLPLLDGGLKKNQKAVSKTNLLKLKKSYQKSIQETSLRLEELFIDAENKRDYIKVSKEFLDASRMRFKISSSQYSTGRINFDNWQIIENELINAEKRYLNALFSAQQAIATYYLELGRGLKQ